MSDLPVTADPAGADPAAEHRYMLVSTGGKLFALALDLVREVVTARPFTPLPGAPAWVSGIVNVRGRVVTVVDLSTRLRLSAAADAGSRRVVVVRCGERDVGIAVDDVLRILRVQPATLEPLPPVEAPSDGASFLTYAGRTERDAFATVDTDALLQPIFG